MFLCEHKASPSQKPAAAPFSSRSGAFFIRQHPVEPSFSSSSLTNRPTADLQQRQLLPTADRPSSLSINVGLQRAPQQQPLLPTTAGHDSFSSDLHARPQIHHQPAAPPEAEEEMKSIAADPNGTDSGEESKSRSKKTTKKNN
jgi:hypothetical protein